MPGPTIFSLWGLTKPKTENEQDKVDLAAAQTTKSEPVLYGAPDTPSVTGLAIDNEIKQTGPPHAFFRPRVPKPKEPPIPVEPPKQAPSYKITLRLRPESLRSVRQPPVHPFFKKQNTKILPVKGPVRHNIKSLPAPWPMYHVLGEHSEPVSRLARRSKVHSKVSGRVSDLVRAEVEESPQDRVFERALMTQSDLVEVIEQVFKPESELRKYYFPRVLSPHPFDLGAKVSKLWTTIHEPTSASAHISPHNVNQVLEWITARMQSLKSKPVQQPKRSRSLPNDFIVDDDDGDQGQPKEFLVLVGPPGTGKTTCVYTAAKMLDAFVLESNAGSRRSGKHISSLLDGIGQSHAVHTSKATRERRKCIVLLDEVDILFENESASFWSVVDKFASTSRRPIVVTCESLEKLPSSIISETRSTIIRFQPPQAEMVAGVAWLVALCEGHVLQPSKLVELARELNCDIRRLISQLQFGCQRGLYSRSGYSWYMKEHELVRGVRVMSVERALSEKHPKPTLIHEPQSLQDVISRTSALSLLDRRQPLESQPRVCIAEEDLARTWLSDEIQVEESVPEFGVDDYLGDQPKGSSQPFLDAIYDNVYVSPHDSVRELVTEIGPPLVSIAFYDAARAHAISQHPGIRLTRRTLAAFNLDGRVYLPHCERLLSMRLKQCAGPQAPSFSRAVPSSHDTCAVQNFSLVADQFEGLS